MSQNGLSFTLRFTIGVAALGVALLVVNQAAGFIVPVLLAWIIVLSASPLLQWLQEKKFPGWLAGRVRSFGSDIRRPRNDDYQGACARSR